MSALRARAVAPPARSLYSTPALPVAGSNAATLPSAEPAIPIFESEESATQPRHILSVRGVGYRFVP